MLRVSNQWLPPDLLGRVASAAQPDAMAAVESLRPLVQLAGSVRKFNLNRPCSKLHLEINGIHLEAPAPPDGICSSVIVTSLFKPGHVILKSKSSLVELWVNGEKTAGFTASAFKDPIDAYTNSTFIGQNDEGGGQFQGVLGRPLIVNERLVADEQNDGNIDNSISSIEGGLCAQLEVSERL